jgi:hypothetical protein
LCYLNYSHSAALAAIGTDSLLFSSMMLLISY